jgi:hypothetical protein
MEKNKELTEIVCALESKAAVNEATIPLYFQLANQTMLSTVEQATCKKIDGKLTVDPSQICLGTWGGLYTNPWINPTNSGCGCSGTTI